MIELTKEEKEEEKDNNKKAAEFFKLQKGRVLHQKGKHCKLVDGKLIFY